MGSLIPKRANTSRLSGQWSDDDYDVLEDGVIVGRIFKVPIAPAERPWMWASGHNGERAVSAPDFSASISCLERARSKPGSGTRERHAWPFPARISKDRHALPKIVIYDFPDQTTPRHISSPVSSEKKQRELPQLAQMVSWAHPRDEHPVFPAIGANDRPAAALLHRVKRSGRG